MKSPEKTLLTGATGFVGASLARELIADGFEVRLLVGASSDRRNVEGLDAEIVTGDLRDEASLRDAVRGCAHVFHCAARYSLWEEDPSVIYEINVEGTRRLLKAAARAGVERCVYTSSVATIDTPGDGRDGDETMPLDPAKAPGDYKKSKVLAERAALEVADETEMPVVVVNPSAPIGPFDVKPTPTGKIIVDFINRKMPAFVETGLNVVHVRDVARGHILALRRGRAGERYILGNRNMTLREIFALLERLTGVPAPRIRMPWGVAYAYGLCSQAWADWVSRKPPMAPIDAVRMAKKKMFFSARKAINELELPQTPVEEAFLDAIAWFERNGHVERRPVESA